MSREQPAKHRQLEHLQDEVYRQMFRLEEGHPSADMLLAVALLRAWMAFEREPAQSEPRRWLRSVCPVCLKMIGKEPGCEGDRPCRIDAGRPATPTPVRENASYEEDADRIMHERRFHPSQAHRLDDPSRREWLPPGEVVDRLALRAGMTVADIGAGTGYFTLPMAEKVGARGQVFAVDVSPEMLARIQAKLGESGAENVRCVEGEASATGLGAESCDVVFMANVWHEFDDHAAVLAEAGRILRKGGRIALLDWRPDVEPEHGPPLEHRIAAEAARQALAEAGFREDAPGVAGKYSWIVSGTKP